MAEMNVHNEPPSGPTPEQLNRVRALHFGAQERAAEAGMSWREAVATGQHSRFIAEAMAALDAGKEGSS